VKKILFAAAVASVFSGCTSVETTTVASSEVVASGGEAVAVIQAECIGLSAIFHLVDIVPADLDIVVNKLLVKEAKDMGATKIELKSASTTPRHGIFALFGGIIGFPASSASGIAVK